MNILERIVEVKKMEVAKAKSLVTASDLENALHFSSPVISTVGRLKDDTLTGIITEFKKASPSKGIINDQVSVEEVVTGYADNGAVAISVLTDEQFFKGSLADLEAARAAVKNVPLLRKDFVIDEYQLLQAKASGADLILLIAACLSPEEVRSLASFAKSLQLEVLLELHAEDELDHICDEVDIVGVNNRDLKTFKVDIEQSIRLASKIPAGKCRISESGIYSMDTIKTLKEGGFEGFLIGENFMREKDPVAAFKNFLKSGSYES